MWPPPPAGGGGKTLPPPGDEVTEARAVNRTLPTPPGRCLAFATGSLWQLPACGAGTLSPACWGGTSLLGLWALVEAQVPT